MKVAQGDGVPNRRCKVRKRMKMEKKMKRKESKKGDGERARPSTTTDTHA